MSSSISTPAALRQPYGVRADVSESPGSQVCASISIRVIRLGRANGIALQGYSRVDGRELWNVIFGNVISRTRAKGLCVSTEAAGSYVTSYINGRR